MFNFASQSPYNQRNRPQVPPSGPALPPRPPMMQNTAQPSRPVGPTPPKKPALYAGPEGPLLTFNTSTTEGRMQYEEELRRAKSIGRDTRSYTDMNGTTSFRYASTKRREDKKGLNIQPLPQE